VSATSPPRAEGAPSLAVPNDLTAGQGLTVVTVTSEREFDALEPAWTALLDGHGSFVFQSFEWNRAWWRHFGEPDPTRAVDPGGHAGRRWPGTCGHDAHVRLTTPAHRAVFGATWDDTLGSLPPETRGKMTRRMRHLARRHDALLELPLDFPQDPEQVDRDVDDFIELHQQRRTTTGQPGAFADAEFAAFVRDAARAQARCGRLVLAFLRIDGERKAAICGRSRS
jgi:CelD/BcsL family acetyltransferase involved in cellulose biosynthesis